MLEISRLIGVLEKALSNVLGAKIDILGSGRTDTGVHASSQIVHLDSPREFDPLLIFRINGYLPKDICIKSARPVRDDAHARFDATARGYEYRIHFFKNPFVYAQSYYFHFKNKPDSLLKSLIHLIKIYVSLAVFCFSNSIKS